MTDQEASGSGDNKAESKFEYETQHFGFTPITLLNGMFNSVCDFYREALKTFCEECKKRNPELDEEKLRQSRHKLSECIDKDICMAFDTLEYFLMNQVFAIPDNVVLPEDQRQLSIKSQSIDLDEKERRKNEIKGKIIAVKYANTLLNQHLEEAEILQATLDEVLKKISSGEILSQAEVKGLKDWLSYYSQLLVKELAQ